ncbi:PQQ-binding-like beta-propeller repeat protein [Actinomadura flavalba]|uniref:PQQ-binding-like beta-propeller repeat protein n=1 Tax=Actinomadura flavalba TaxID=1120938 RepID=UPI00035DC7FE|nr:PQQ-binding-like beta-propeller repeat protein [Actinomadura flavalba]
MVLAAGCAVGAGAEDTRGWTARDVDVVSRTVVGGGVVAVTGRRGDGGLETVVFDLARGERMWRRAAVMPGRLPTMGVQPPAVVETGGGALVAAVEPRDAGRYRAVLSVRDARSGAERWTRPVRTSFGPAACGPNVCLSEFTTRPEARFVALDPASGRVRWRMPGTAEVLDQDAGRVVLFRLARRPVVEARHPGTGRTLWRYPVEKGVGTGISLAGGWTFGRAGDRLVGYVAPPSRPHTSGFGFFALRVRDGAPLWHRPGLTRVYPGPSPAVAVLARPLTSQRTYGGFERVDPADGRTATVLTAARTPRGAWRPAFPADLSRVGFLAPDAPGAAYTLSGAEAPTGDLPAWTFCAERPAELRPAGGARGFYPVAALCAYDLSTGRKIAEPGVPPVWYTGSVDGRRLWRDEHGALHAVRDDHVDRPGMYGAS